MNRYLFLIASLFAGSSLLCCSEAAKAEPFDSNDLSSKATYKASNSGQWNDEIATEVTLGEISEAVTDSWAGDNRNDSNETLGQEDLKFEGLDQSALEEYEDESIESSEYEQTVARTNDMDESREFRSNEELDLDDHSIANVEDVAHNEDVGVDDVEYSNEDEDSDDGSKLPHTMHLKMMILGKNERKVKVVVAAKTTVEVWKNFKLVGSVKSWRRAVKFLFKARIGDSITLVSKGFKKHFGIAAIIYTGGKRCYVTGGHGRHFFKAIGLKTLKRLKKPDLRTSRRGMCYLRHPYTVKHQRGRRTRFATKGMALYLLRHKAKYVWARGARSNDPVCLRFVVGGDRCNKPKPSKKPSPSPIPKAGGGGARCPCRVVPGATRSECFEFRNKQFSEVPNKVGSCYRRQCGLKYECVEPGRSSRIVCVRQFARYEVRSVGPMFKGKCKNVRLRTAQPFYAPYS